MAWKFNIFTGKPDYYEESSGGGDPATTATITHVANYSALPDPTTVGLYDIYVVDNAQGNKFWYGAIGGTYYPAGAYYSDLTKWIYSESASKATQAEVNTGTDTEKYITAETFNNAAKWATLQNSIGNIVFVAEKADLPAPSSGVITLLANVTYYFTTVIDLTGDRLVCGQDTVILGSSSENCFIVSTGLNSSTALITSVYSLPIRHISFTHGTVFNLDGDGVTTALDWFGVNFLNCANIGTIRDYTNFVMGDSAFLNSAGLIFDGAVGTIAFGNCLFDGRSASTAITLASTLVVSRRFRIIYSSFVTLSGETSLFVDPAATITNERYILDTVNFSGGGSYITGVDQVSNKALFTNCVGIANTTTRGFFYMVNNTVDTTIGVPNTNVWVKASGVTIPDASNSKFSHSSNRLTYTGAFNTSFLIMINSAVRSSAGNQNISIGIAKNGTILPNSEMTIRTAVSNQEYPGGTQYQIELVTNDFIEVFIKNTSSNEVRVSDLNLSCVKILV